MTDKEAQGYVVEKTKELIGSPTCCKEAKEAAQNWLDSLGTEGEAQAAQRYVAELEGDIMPVDQLIGFAESETGIQYFGAETAANLASHAKEIKAAGAKYCDCPACAAVEAILEKKDAILN